jgi:hypothetical protein
MPKRALIAVPFVLLASVSPALAAVLWDGDAAKGTDVFDGVECTGGSVTVASDPAHGPVWKFFFPDGDTRCEVRGSKGYDVQQGTEIYVGWRVKYDVALGTLRYVFQMKGYPPPALQANHPVVFATEQDNLVLINYDLKDQRHTIWQKPITRGGWQSIVLHMKIALDPTVGFIELWYDGAKQTFTNGMDRIPANTFDAGRTLVKWGIYRGGQGPGDCYEYLARPRIGTTYDDVAPEGSSGPADGGGSPPLAAPDAAPAVDAPVTTPPAPVDASAAPPGQSPPVDAAPGAPPPPSSHGCQLGGRASATPLGVVAVALLLLRRRRRGHGLG